MTGLPPVAAALKDHLRETRYIMCFKDSFGMWQVLSWWEHLGQGYAGPS